MVHDGVLLLIGAVWSQAGLGRRVLECLYDSPAAACAELVVNSSRFIAGQL
jgi:hypothetical protein